MFKPPLDPPDRVEQTDLTWRSIVAAYGLAGLFVFASVVSHLWNTTAGAVATVALIVAGRRAYGLSRRAYEEPSFSFTLGGKVQVTITQPPREELN